MDNVAGPEIMNEVRRKLNLALNEPCDMDASHYELIKRQMHTLCVVINNCFPGNMIADRNTMMLIVGSITASAMGDVLDNYPTSQSDLDSRFN